jgi:hypothetical protein
MRYRLFALDERGRVLGFVGMDHSNDAEAIAAVEKGYPHQALELWQGQRHVRAFAGRPALGLLKGA